MCTDVDEEVWSFEGAGALARVWVRCLMDGHSSAFLSLCTPTRPPLPLLSPPLGDEQAHYYGVLIKGGHYLFTVHFELWQRNLLLPVSSFWLCNALIGGSLPMFSCTPTLGSSPRRCHGHIHRILACQRTKSISISILPWCFCQQIWSLSLMALRKTSSITYCEQNHCFYWDRPLLLIRSVLHVYFIVIYFLISGHRTL